MKFHLVKEFYDKNYYFSSKKELKNYFIFDGDKLLKALEKSEIIKLDDNDIVNLKYDSKNIISGINLISNTNGREIYNFNYLSKNVIFKSILKEFIRNLKLQEEQINDLIIFTLKKKILIKSRIFPKLLLALEMEDTILKYFLIKIIRKRKNDFG